MRAEAMGRAVRTFSATSLGVLVMMWLSSFGHTQLTPKPFQGTSQHRSRGSDYLTAEFVREINDDGTVTHTIMYADRTYRLVAGPEGKPIEYNVESGKGSSEYQFSPGEVVWTWRSADKPPTEHRQRVAEEALPDFNSRPDPYLMQYLLVQAYDFAAGGEQILHVFDIDNQGKGMVEYELSLELVDEDGVMLPTGKFKARHLQQTQVTGGGTWYKKGRGSQTEIWVDDDLLILRIYRHREPYETFLTDYNNPAGLLAADEMAAAYDAPAQAPPAAGGMKSIPPPDALPVVAKVPLGEGLRVEMNWASLRGGMRGRLYQCEVIAFDGTSLKYRTLHNNVVHTIENLADNQYHHGNWSERSDDTLPHTWPWIPLAVAAELDAGEAGETHVILGDLLAGELHEYVYAGDSLVACTVNDKPALVRCWVLVSGNGATISAMADPHNPVVVASYAPGQVLERAAGISAPDIEFEPTLR